MRRGQAYAPLAVGSVLKNPAANSVAKAHDKTAAQVAIRWLVQRGAVTIPGANTAQYMAEDLSGTQPRHLSVQSGRPSERMAVAAGAQCSTGS